MDNISYRTTEEDIARIFDRYGEIGDIYIPRDYGSGGMRGFAFVRFYSRRDAEYAIEHVDGKQMDGRELRCQVAMHPRPGPRGPPVGYGPPPGFQAQPRYFPPFPATRLLCSALPGAFSLVAAMQCGDSMWRPEAAGGG